MKKPRRWVLGEGYLAVGYNSIQVWQSAQNIASVLPIEQDIYDQVNGKKVRLEAVEID